MLVRVSNIRVPVTDSEAELPALLARELKVPPTDLVRWRILKKSLDARSRIDLQWVFTIVAEVADGVISDEEISRQPTQRIALYAPDPFDDPEPGQIPLTERPVVVGSGPAGLLAAYYLAFKGFRPIILERGFAVKDRVSAVREFDAGGEFDRENNYLFGEGGAGCFSDGKLTCRMEGPDVNWVFERFVECGGRPSIVYENRPHLGSNKLPMICRNFRRKIEALGGEYRFGCRLESIDIRDGQVRGVGTSSGYLPTSQVFLGIGHSARDTYRMLHEIGVPMLPKAFQLGVRIEQPQDQVNKHKYGRSEYLNVLGAADYTLNARSTRDVFTFCMCAGGIIIPSVSEPEMFCSNGMSNSRHDTPFANSGIVVTLEPQEFGSSHPLAGMELQRQFEAIAFQRLGGNYECPIQSAYDFVAGRTPSPTQKLDCSYKRGVKPLALDEVLPIPIAEALRKSLPLMDRKFHGDFLKNAILVGPEMRGSSPIRIDREWESRQTPGISGLYPIGEGAGYAGGIVSAAVDGLRSARQLVRQFRLT